MHKLSYRPLLILLLLLISASNSLAGELLWHGSPDKKPVKLNLTHPGNRFSVLRVFFSSPDERLNLELSARTKVGTAVYESRFTENINASDGLEQILDRLTQLPGNYDLKLYGKGASCSVYLEEMSPLTPFTPGDKLGELVVKSTCGVQVIAVPERFLIKHPDFKKGMEKGIATPDGDVIFRLPAGYWSLSRIGKGKENARLIPVNSGGRTVVEWSSAPELDISGSSGGTVRRLEIRDVNPDSDQNLALCRFALPAGLSSSTPEISQLQIHERFLNGEIVDLKQSDTPLHLVLLLDSSGSMKKSMKSAVAATVSFIENLPENAIVSVIDFDTRPKVIKAGSRAELIKAVRAIKADGATALRDSIILGLDQLKQSPRPALVVFTDGFDANHNDTGPGSKATEKEMLTRVTAAKTPIFTIGFGSGADSATLARLADLSGGIFQNADEQNLDNVFARLEATVAREYLLTYRRPQKSGMGIRPVISVCVDTSGSMASNLENGVIGSRRVTARKTLHSMCGLLPPDALLQILDFDASTEITQTATADRARAQAGIAAFKDGGGTNIVKALEVGLEAMLGIPSNRRYMLFLTDEAVKCSNKTEEEKLNRLLNRMKDENIFSMWIGMVGKNGAAPFVETAEKCGGEAIIAENLVALNSTIDRLLAKAGEPVDDSHIPIELVWQMPVVGGQPLAVSGNGIFVMPPLAKSASETREAVDSLQISFDQADTHAADNAATTVSPAGSAASSSLVTPVVEKPGPAGARIALNLDIKAQNDACSFHINGMSLHEDLNGVKAPKGKLFAVFSVELTNILPEQDVAVYPDGGQHPAQWLSRPEERARIIKAVPPYKIDDLRRHLFLRWNADSPTSVSPATWLLQDSLCGFGNNSLTIVAGKPAKGSIAFIVSDGEGLSNGSLDFFDTSYGHAGMVIAGTMEPLAIDVTALPTRPAGKLGSAFSVSLTGCKDVVSPLAGATAGRHLVWRLIEGCIESQVQALLDIDPSARMYLTVPTQAGPVRRPVSPVTSLLPDGFFDRIRLAPGSKNYFRQAFLLPAELAATASGTIGIDLKGDDCFINLDQAEQPATNTSGRQWNSEGNGLKLKLNAHGPMAAINGKKGNWYVVDATIADIADGTATRVDKLFFLGRADLKDQEFALKPGERLMKSAGNKAGHKGMANFSGKNEADGNQARIYPDSLNKQLMFAANSGAIIPDGQELRLIAVFRRPTTGEYLLTAEGLPLAEPMGSEEPKELPAWLLAENDENVPAQPEIFQKELAGRLKQLAQINRQKGITPDTGSVVDADGAVSSSPVILDPPLISPDARAADNQFKVEVIIEAEPAGEGAAAQTGAAASALSGGSQKFRSFKLISIQLAAANTCRNPWEIIYTDMPGADGEKLIKASIISSDGGHEGRDGIDLNSWKPVREKIIISGKGVSFPVFERELSADGLKDRIHSVALAMPDITAAEYENLLQRWQKARSELPPAHLSLWQWFAHARLAAFIAAQTEWETTTARQMGVTLSREKNPRLLVITGSKKTDGSMEARLDLASVQPAVAGEEQTVKAFKIASGIHVTGLEARIMKGAGVFEFWGNNRLQIIADSGRQKNAWLKFAASRGVSERALKAIKSSRSIVLFPQNPAVIDGQPFWAWLEIDPKSYATIGVLETGERGALAGEAIIQALIPDGAGLALGFWKGVETSVWGMSAFILEGNTALEAAANTEKLLGDLSEQLGKIGESVEISVGDASIDVLSGKVTLAGFSSEGDYSPWEGHKGFISGFNSGVEWYLGKVKAAAAAK